MKYEIMILQMRMLKNYEENIRHYEQQIDDIIYKFVGVRGIRYDKQSVSFNELIANEKRYLMMKELEVPQKQLDFAINAVNQLKPIVEDNLNKLPKETKQMFIEYAYKRKTYNEIGEMFGYTGNGVWKKMRREIAKL